MRDRIGTIIKNNMGVASIRAIDEIIALIDREIIGDDVDIANILNPNGTGAGQHYPGLVDLPSQGIAYMLEGVNKFKKEQRKKLRA